MVHNFINSAEIHPNGNPLTTTTMEKKQQEVIRDDINNNNSNNSLEAMKSIGNSAQKQRLGGILKRWTTVYVF